MLKLAATFTTILALTVITKPAHADEPDADAADEQQPTAVIKQAHADEHLPTVSLTVSPLHALISIGEATAEVRVARKVGIAATVGGGAPYFESIGARATTLEGGLSARYYALGTFRTGLQLGAEALYVHVATDARMVVATGAGVALSPFIGYKWTHHSGFTLEGQAGVSFIAVHAQTDAEKAADSDVSVLLNLNVGYGF